MKRASRISADWQTDFLAHREQREQDCNVSLGQLFQNDITWHQGLAEHTGSPHANGVAAAHFNLYSQHLDEISRKVIFKQVCYYNKKSENHRSWFCDLNPLSLSY